jgi:hypothetical protein
VASSYSSIPVREDNDSGPKDLKEIGRIISSSTGSLSGSIWDVGFGSDGRGSRRRGEAHLGFQ